MADFERELREGLRRVDAPEGFADRVVKRVEMRVRERRGMAARGAWWRGVAAVLLVGLAVGGWFVQRERTERMAAREAREQFEVAMRVTTRVTQRSFAEAQRRINRSLETEGQQGETQ